LQYQSKKQSQVMIVGIGIDLVNLAEFTNSVSNNYRVKEKLFTQKEIMLGDNSLAECFASKEALIKAIDNNQAFRWKNAEITHDNFGKPKFVFHSELSELMKTYDALLTITRTKTMAQAVVVLQAR